MALEVSAELLGVTEPGYALDGVVELPDGTKPELTYDVTADVTGGTAYEVEALMELEAVEETG